MKQHLTTLFLVLAVLNVFGQNADELNQQAKKFIETQQFDKAVPLLKQSAGLGNAEAQYNFLPLLVLSPIVFQSDSFVGDNTNKGVSSHTNPTPPPYRFICILVLVGAIS